MSRALALFSGGLDSMLAARLVMEQGVEVVALQFITPFFNYKHKGREDEAAREFYKKYGIDCRIIDVSTDYIKMIRAPRYGYGKNFNPCIDCKIFMMRKAKAMMAELDADFVLSGEVLGQRPMSQRKDALRIVERDSGLDGLLLRPLCAKLMKPTVPEERGLVDRERLMDISGRSRRRQMELAERFGISEYQTPAGGCMLTDPILSKRIEKLLGERDDIWPEDVQLMAVGRHFILPGGKLFVGRNNADNLKLASLVRQGDMVLKVLDVPGPIALFRGGPTRDALTLSARITARYSDSKAMESVAVGVSGMSPIEEKVTVTPITDDELEGFRAVY